MLGLFKIQLSLLTHCKHVPALTKEANVKTAWLAHISVQNCQQLNKGLLEKFLP